MRSTIDLIEELREQATRFKVVVFVVRVDQDHVCLLSWDHRKDPQWHLDELNSLVTDGAMPVGFVRANNLAENPDISTRILEEYAGNQKAKNWFKGVEKVFERRLNEICEEVLKEVDEEERLGRWN